MADGSVAYGSLPFKEQIAFFRAKKNVLTDRWTDVWEEAHDQSFMVAGANRIDLLADMRAAVDKAIAQGTTLAEFRKDFDTIVARYGWDYTGGRNWRSRVIYETNLRTSYAAGRWSQLQALVKVRPFWRYVHSDSVQHPRPMHLAWNGLVLPANHPWWMRHFPPNGWGCQCTIQALNLRDLKRLGKEGPDQPPPDDMQPTVVGQRGPAPMIVDTPAGVDPGFGYAPGRAAFDSQVQNLASKAQALPTQAAAQALAEPLALPRAQASLDRGLQRLVDDVVTGRSPDQPSRTIGALTPDLVRALASHEIRPAVATLEATAERLGHALASAAPAQVSKLVQASAILRDPQAVLLAGADARLLYVGGAQADGSPLTVNMAVDGGIVLDNVTDADLTSLREAMAAGRLILLKGTLN
ncbi:MAG: hypothetical protein GAK28_00701 [Luteibacter sp.]|uniref:phage minor head protein n=1 Tax=Luteibacter sp. TaxID=1886636 RepID=UPI00137FC0A2|nr:phage minor head protein [Luteibacter sp.]KAF1009068.1 MAG: hypothetical protein GAK28_00701 [Luteibacter sp.]